jgi:hypothetical protein
VEFQLITTKFDESVYITDSRPSILIYVAIPLSDHTMSSLEILYNTIYKEGVKYAVSIYNISIKAYKELPNRLVVLRYCLSIYPLII